MRASSLVASSSHLICCSTRMSHGCCFTLQRQSPYPMHCGCRALSTSRSSGRLSRGQQGQQGDGSGQHSPPYTRSSFACCGSTSSSRRRPAKPPPLRHRCAVQGCLQDSALAGHGVRTTCAPLVQHRCHAAWNSFGTRFSRLRDTEAERSVCCTAGGSVWALRNACCIARRTAHPCTANKRHSST